MDYQAFTNESLTMMYEAVRGALAADDTVERQGGDPKFKDAYDRLMELQEHLGHRDFWFVANVLYGQGIHGAMLHEAGLPWRLKDDTPVSAAGGILSGGGSYKIVPEFSDASQTTARQSSSIQICFGCTAHAALPIATIANTTSPFRIAARSSNANPKIPAGTIAAASLTKA